MSQAEQTTRFDAFISHAGPDKKKALAICSDLESMGLRCWIAPRNVMAGADFSQAIIEGVEGSKCLILLLSENTETSEYVVNEVERAKSYGKQIFTIRMSEVEIPKNLELFLSLSQWIDYRAIDFPERLQQVAEQIMSGAASKRRSQPPGLAVLSYRWLKRYWFIPLAVMAGLATQIDFASLTDGSQTEQQSLIIGLALLGFLAAAVMLLRAKPKFDDSATLSYPSRSSMRTRQTKVARKRDKKEKQQKFAAVRLKPLGKQPKTAILQSLDGVQKLPLNMDLLHQPEGIILGRAIELVHIHMEDTKISRRHLRLKIKEGHFTLEDLNSTYGTCIDGERIVPFAAVPVKAGQLIRIAEYSYTIRA